MAKRKKHGVQWWKKKTWNIFSKYIRLRDAIATTGRKDALLCCTCQKQYPAFGKGCAQAGHFIPSRGNAILFDERGVHGQCYNCNINLKGNWPEYYKFMATKHGPEVINELLLLKKTVRKYTTTELEEMHDKYKDKIAELEGE